MSVFRVSMIVECNAQFPRFDDGSVLNETQSTITTRFAGCATEADAKRKARELYTVVVFKKVELLPDEK